MTLKNLIKTYVLGGGGGTTYTYHYEDVMMPVGEYKIPFNGRIGIPTNKVDANKVTLTDWNEIVLGRSEKITPFQGVIEFTKRTPTQFWSK